MNCSYCTPKTTVTDHFGGHGFAPIWINKCRNSMNISICFPVKSPILDLWGSPLPRRQEARCSCLPQGFGSLKDGNFMLGWPRNGGVLPRKMVVLPMFYPGIDLKLWGCPSVLGCFLGWNWDIVWENHQTKWGYKGCILGYVPSGNLT